MADYQTLLDNIALVVGGTAPDLTNRPHFYSGAEVGDGTELGHGTLSVPLKGCWSIPPPTIEQSPYALVLPGDAEISGPEKPDVFVLGEEWNVDVVRIQFFISLFDNPTSWATIIPYRDVIPTVFRANMTLKGSPNVIAAMPRSLKPVVLGDYAGTEYVGWEVNVHVQRVIQPTYSA